VRGTGKSDEAYSCFDGGYCFRSVFMLASPNAYTDSHTHGNPYADFDIDPYPDTHVDTNGHCHSHQYEYADCHRDAHRDANTDQHTNGN